MKIFRTAIITAALFSALGLSAANAVTIYDGHEYEFVADAGITWTDAHAAAIGLGAGWDLVSITDAAENAFVASLLPVPPFDRSHVWIGASDAASEGNFVWSNGDAFTYSDWWNGEPNNSGGDENYAAFDYRDSGWSWAWNDVTNTTLYPPINGGDSLILGYIAENATAVPEPATWAMFLVGFGGIGFMLRRPLRKVAAPSA